MLEDPSATAYSPGGYIVGVLSLGLPMLALIDHSLVLGVYTLKSYTLGRYSVGV